MATRTEIRTVIPEITDEQMGKLLDLIHKETDVLRDDKKKLEDDLAAANKAAETAKTEKEKAETALKEYKDEQGRKEAKSKHDAAAAEVARDAGVAEKYIRYVLHESGADSWELGDDGKIKDAKCLIETIKNDFADYVSTTTVTGAQVDNPPVGGSTAFSSMSLVEKMEYANAHPGDPAVSAWLNS